MNQPIFEITEQDNNKSYSKFVISPLEQGYGHTLGNSLRRVLLKSLGGAAITSVRISQVKHQFSTLKGMKEDVVEFLLNLKKVRFSYDGEKPITVKLSAKGPGEVKAKDIQVPANLKIANPEAVLAFLNKGAKIDAQMEVTVGEGYLSADDREEKSIGLIPLDAIFSPVIKVNYKIEETRVGRFTNYDKLILEIWTDGTIKPKDALIKSADILISYFKQILSPKKVEKQEVKIVDTLGPTGKLSVEEIGLPTRVANALIKAGYETVEDLVKVKKEDLVKVRNLGEKSIKIVAAALADKDINFS
ncbi:DNA-directed RNA polymerase subunit alpha [Candidatus Woesebacteria bacterium RBG_16_36_11]|uniref:DNA-directed RNA polymerase subunit alpha n=3 Tax=Candidatus Woeseibacteriota TaxID=1752722 RepID=A0A1F7XBF4_9BACT|nr:MAG: DNA-directed RNA polymerase subunit alpha [Candidatus Woesebacteria bacterium RBG_13_36_22]OGM12360.1 MAG: DNA-directed RNA polymerase subunit alpha [Candidatus Woesebacteria bacterium RBG_16_36_11]OGM17221.1 MAG: DNA-directed RNA polymerase subunit alpha [Candidatus Woesebacteria bacterium RBG_19FT_COMBO_37_29]